MYFLENELNIELRATVKGRIFLSRGHLPRQMNVPAKLSTHASEVRGRGCRTQAYPARLRRDLFPCKPPPSSHIANAMATDFDGQWKKARTAAITDEAESIRTLAKILSSKEGRTFVFDLEPQDAAFCIDMLDHVSTNPTPHSTPTASVIPS